EDHISPFGGNRAHGNSTVRQIGPPCHLRDDRARRPPRQPPLSIIPKSGYRFSEKIMLHQQPRRDADSTRGHPAVMGRRPAHAFRGLLSGSCFSVASARRSHRWASASLNALICGSTAILAAAAHSAARARYQSAFRCAAFRCTKGLIHLPPTTRTK